MNYTSLKECYVEEIAAIISNNYKKAGLAMPILSESFENVEMHIKMLKKYIDNDKFIVALDNGKVAGFINGFGINNFKGTVKGALSIPSFHGVGEGYDKDYLYSELYRRVCEVWVNSGCYTHCIMIYENDMDTIDTWVLNGFGKFVIDAVRPLDILDLPKIEDNISIRRAGECDLPQMADLFEGLDNHLASTPICLYNHSSESYVDEYSEWLKTEGNILWVAEKDNKIIGYIKTNTTEINIDELQDGETMGVSGAYVFPEYRGSHIMARLLNAATEWAIENGLKKCSTDFEAANIEGRRFWLKHFTPFCISMIRRVDERNHLALLSKGE